MCAKEYKSISSAFSYSGEFENDKHWVKFFKASAARK